MTQICNEPDCKGYKFEDPYNKDSELNSLKFIFTVDIPIDTAFRMMNDGQVRKLWDTKIYNPQVLEGDIETSAIVYQAIKTPFVVSDRDIVMKVDVIKNYKGYKYIVSLNSTDHPSKPESSSVGVRAKLTNSFGFLKTLPNRRTEISGINCVDPNGYIPDMVKNMMLDGMAKQMKDELVAGYKELKSKGIV